jgi:hypothetical protein
MIPSYGRAFIVVIANRSLMFMYTYTQVFPLISRSYILFPNYTFAQPTLVRPGRVFLEQRLHTVFQDRICTRARP